MKRILAAKSLNCYNLKALLFQGEAYEYSTITS